MQLVYLRDPHCGWCHLLEQRTLGARVVEDALWCDVRRLDIDAGAGRDLAARHRVSGTPHFLLLADCGDLLDAFSGMLEPFEFLERLAPAVDHGMTVPSLRELMRKDPGNDLARWDLAARLSSAGLRGRAKWHRAVLFARDPLGRREGGAMLRLYRTLERIGRRAMSDTGGPRWDPLLRFLERCPWPQVRYHGWRQVARNSIRYEQWERATRAVRGAWEDCPDELRAYCAAQILDAPEQVSQAVPASTFLAAFRPITRLERAVAGWFASSRAEEAVPAFAGKFT